jgi:hypothetical protein
MPLGTLTKRSAVSGRMLSNSYGAILIANPFWLSSASIPENLVM